MARNAALAGALVIIALLAYLTLSVVIREGFDILVVASMLILAMLGFGVLGALTSSSDE